MLLTRAPGFVTRQMASGLVLPLGLGAAAERLMQGASTSTARSATAERMRAGDSMLGLSFRAAQQGCGGTTTGDASRLLQWRARNATATLRCYDATLRRLGTSDELGPVDDQAATQ